MSSSPQPSRFAVVVAFGLVYFFWGSTYLAIDIAVEKIPPALMCGIRFLIAGVVLLAFCGLRGRKILYQPIRLLEMAIVGKLLLGDHHISLRGKIGLGLGVAGLVVLLWPQLVSETSFGRTELWSSISLI